MMKFRMNLPASFGARRHALNVAAYEVRRQATGAVGDIDMWHLSRLMREAETDAQVNVAERKYDVWLQTLAP